MPTQKPSDTRLQGAIRKLKGGYGFIAGDDGNDYFFHWSALEHTSKNFRELTVQERVEFSVIEVVFKGEKKKRGVQMRVLPTSLEAEQSIPASGAEAHV